jgi:hypothetical protein
VKAAADHIVSEGVVGRFCPLSFSEAVRHKKLTKTLGAPYQYTFGTYKRYVEHLGGGDLEKGYAEMARLLEQYEREILDGKSVFPIYTAASKRDMYTRAKIVGERYRSLCGSGLFELLMCIRWFYFVDSSFKHEHPRVYAVHDPSRYLERTHKLRKLWCFGLDLTAYDKTVPADFSLACVEALSEHVDGLQDQPHLSAFFPTCVLFSCDTSSRRFFVWCHRWESLRDVPYQHHWEHCASDGRFALQLFF